MMTKKSGSHEVVGETGLSGRIVCAVGTRSNHRSRRSSANVKKKGTDLQNGQNEEVEVGGAPELFEQVDGHEIPRRVLGRDDLVAGERRRGVGGVPTAHRHRPVTLAAAAIALLRTAMSEEEEEEEDGAERNRIH